MARAHKQQTRQNKKAADHPWIVISGASSGIGLACAEELAAAGYGLILCARRRERLQALAAKLEDLYAIPVVVVAADVRDQQQLTRAFQPHLALLQNVVALINNAGLSRGLSPLQQGEIDDWQEMIDTNIKGVLYLTRMILPYMVTNKKGHVLFIGSIAGVQNYPGGAVYSATKAAVRTLSDSLRLDLNGTGVRVTNIEPGMLESEFSIVRFHGDEKRAKEVYKGMRPLQAKDVAETVAWCLSRPNHINIQELIIMPTDQASTTLVHRSHA